MRGQPNTFLNTKGKISEVDLSTGSLHKSITKKDSFIVFNDSQRISPLPRGSPSPDRPSHTSVQKTISKHINKKDHVKYNFSPVMIDQQPTSNNGVLYSEPAVAPDDMDRPKLLSNAFVSSTAMNTLN